MIYICIPAYNEERTIGVLLWKLRQVMTEFPRDYEVLVVDDASTDATAEVLEPYTRILPLTVHRNTERQGYSASLETLIREAVRRSAYPKRDAIVTLQADFTEEPEEVPSLVKRIEGGADVVTSAVHTRTEDVPRGVRWSRTALRFLLRRSNWPDEITDPLSGFRAYRVIGLKKLLDARNGKPLVEWDGWAANVALLRAVLPYARRVEETPLELTHHRRSRASRLSPWETGRQVLRLMRTADDEGELGSKVRGGRRRGRPPRGGESDGEARREARREARPNNRAEPKSGRKRRDGERRSGGGGRPRRERGPRTRGQDATEPGRDQRQPEAEGREPAEASAAPDNDGEDAHRPRKRRRRGGRRRGGRRRTGGQNGETRTAEPTSGKEGNGPSRDTAAGDS